MIARIIIKDKDKNQSVMLFGNSYKKFYVQVADFFYRTQEWKNNLPYPRYEIVSATFSKSAWKSWGGLKWCEEKDFQQELNREGCQSSDKDNPNPRIYKDMVFCKNYYYSKKLKDFYNHQYSDRDLI